jgi:hypothetical protein
MYDKKRKKMREAVADRMLNGVKLLKPVITDSVYI